MKRILFAVVLCVMSMNAFAQKYYQYSDVIGTAFSMSSTWKYNDETGSISVTGKKKFEEKFGEYVEFETIQGFLNYLALKGWEVISSTYDSSHFSYVLRKEVTKEELQKVVENGKKK